MGSRAIALGPIGQHELRSGHPKMLVEFEHLYTYTFTYTFWDQAGNYLLQSHKPFERGTADDRVDGAQVNSSAASSSCNG